MLGTGRRGPGTPAGWDEAATLDPGATWRCVDILPSLPSSVYLPSSGRIPRDCHSTPNSAPHPGDFWVAADGSSGLWPRTPQQLSSMAPAARSRSGRGPVGSAHAPPAPGRRHEASPAFTSCLGTRRINASSGVPGDSPRLVPSELRACVLSLTSQESLDPECPELCPAPARDRAVPRSARAHAW